MKEYMLRILGGVLLGIFIIVIKSDLVSASAQISISNTNVNMQVTPTNTGQTVISSARIDITTTGAKGYTLSLSSAGSTNLVNYSSSSEVITSVSSSRVIDNFMQNTWGYCFGTTQCVSSNIFSAIPSSEVTLASKNYENDTYAASDVYYLTYGVKVSNNVLTGVYNNTQIISVVAEDYSYTQTYAYTGSEVEWTVPVSGEYKLEAWGAEGGYGIWGSDTSIRRGGYGAYATGVISLSAGEKLYINVGQMGQQYSGGYNGGGSGAYSRVAEYSGGGGGASHIATKSGLLSTLENDIDKILIVAAGGGGCSTCAASTSTRSYGSGGGIVGSNSSPTGSIGATQNSGGTLQPVSISVTNAVFYGVVGAFGQGGNGYKYSNNRCETAGGGGGGFYGGAASNVGGSGGSSYIGNTRLSNKAMHCYRCTTSSDESTKTVSQTIIYSSATAERPKSGHGAIRITYIES